MMHFSFINPRGLSSFSPSSPLLISLLGRPRFLRVVLVAASVRQGRRQHAVPLAEGHGRDVDLAGTRQGRHEAPL